MENTLEDSSDGVWKYAVENGLGPSSMATVIRWLGTVQQYSSSGRPFSDFFVVAVVPILQKCQTNLI